MMRLLLFYFFRVEYIITANGFYSLLKMYIPNIFISCFRKKSHGFGQSACVKDSFSSFIVPHRIRPLWSLSEFPNLLLHCYQSCALESKGSPRNPCHYDVLHLSCLLWWMLSNNVKPFFPSQKDRFSSGVQCLQNKSEKKSSTEWANGALRSKYGGSVGVWVFLVIISPKRTIVTSEIN